MKTLSLPYGVIMKSHYKKNILSHREYVFNLRTIDDKVIADSLVDGKTYVIRKDDYVVIPAKHDGHDIFLLYVMRKQKKL